MFVLVEHYVTQPQAFWSGVDHALKSMPANATLHHCFPTPDGTHAICIWEAEALADVRAFLETYVGHVSRNLFFEVENGSGIATPARL
ncbi:MAG TPA: hypothetical protein VFE05_18775 [Longimicrobiaceae bacterium]|jgi:hypothetical protein|nr:hypothetical protein [Longimicrobiaceae bacterium]